MTQVLTRINANPIQSSTAGLKAVLNVGQSRLWLLVILTYLTWRCRCLSHRKALGLACPWGDCGLEKGRRKMESVNEAFRLRVKEKG